MAERLAVYDHQAEAGGIGPGGQLRPKAAVNACPAKRIVFATRDGFLCRQSIKGSLSQTTAEPQKSAGSPNYPNSPTDSFTSLPVVHMRFISTQAGGRFSYRSAHIRCGWQLTEAQLRTGYGRRSNRLIARKYLPPEPR